MVNPALATGEVEVVATALEVLARADTPPFVIEDRAEADELLRLEYRYLDLRRPEMTANLRLRHRVTRLMREHLDALGFVEVETPMLGRATPEGSRDFLVPARMRPGTFFALPQSPQQLKQLLMVGGQDRYYQIVRCLRDEATRADRGFEFTQLDIEMAFVDEEDVIAVIEPLYARIIAETQGVEVPVPFRRMHLSTRWSIGSAPTSRISATGWSSSTWPTSSRARGSRPSPRSPPTAARSRPCARRAAAP